MIDKLIMVNTKEHLNLEYGTILSVIRVHRNRKGYMATEAENENVFPVYVAFKECREI